MKDLRDVGKKPNFQKAWVGLAEPAGPIVEAEDGMWND
jgi:hypothetical protein